MIRRQEKALYPNAENVAEKPRRLAQSHLVMRYRSGFLESTAGHAGASGVGSSSPRTMSFLVACVTKQVELFSDPSLSFSSNRLRLVVTSSNLLNLCRSEVHARVIFESH